MPRLQGLSRARAVPLLCCVVLVLSAHAASAAGRAPSLTAAVVSLPARIEAADYRPGGEGVGYHDTTAGNTGGAYRGDDVDIQRCSEPTSAAPCYNVGWVRQGEWLAYDVSVPAAGTYDIATRLATPYGQRFFHLELDGSPITGQLAIPMMGGWQSWTTVTAPGVALPAGVHVLRLVADTSGFNINYLTFTALGGPPPSEAVTIAAAGDIACSPRSSYYNDGYGDATRCRQYHTSQLLVDGDFDVVLTLGDNQ